MAACFCPAVAPLVGSSRSRFCPAPLKIRSYGNKLLLTTSAAGTPPPPPPQRGLRLRFSPSQLGLGLHNSLRRAPAFWGRRGAVVVVSARGSDGAVAERVLAAVGYVLPLLDGMQYGRYVFAQYPVSEVLFRPLFPLLRLYASIPYSNFVVFFALYLAVVRNPSFGRYVRFNAMQACVLDVLIVLPLIIQRIFNPRSGLGLDLLIIFYNTIFIGLLAAVVFGVVSCLIGRTPRLPVVADAAENQLF